MATAWEFAKAYLGLMVVAVALLSPAAVFVAEGDPDFFGTENMPTAFATKEVTGDATRDITAEITRDITGDATKEVTGKLTYGTAAVSIFVMEQSNVSFTALLGDDNSSVVLLWGSSDADNYSIYATENMSEGFAGPPIAEGLTGTNYTDPDAHLYRQRYYQLREWKEGAETINPLNVGKFDLVLEVATQTPGEVEMNAVSFPLLLSNDSVQEVLYFGTDLDLITTYNTESMPTKYDSVSYFSPFGWLGDFSEFSETRGYAFTIVGQPYNLTVAGGVPTGDVTVELKKCSLDPNGIEINYVGWNSVHKGCNMSSLFPDANEGDTIATFDPYASPQPKYITVTLFNVSGNMQWSGEFLCFEPGNGYLFTVVGNAYNWTYSRDA